MLQPRLSPLVLLFMCSLPFNAVGTSPSCTPSPREHGLSDAIFRPVEEQILFKRDACADAFGNGWMGSFCTPGSTYCCVNPSKAVPLCQQYLGIGWCCTQDGGCYADLQSACGQPGAVSCTDLAQGVDEACCPQYTTCASGYNASANFVRCNIQQTKLQALASSTSTLAGASTVSLTVSQDAAAVETTSNQPSTPASIALDSSSSNAVTASTISSAVEPTVPTSTGPTTESTSTASSVGSPTLEAVSYVEHEDGVTLSTGAIAGIAVGATAAGLLIAVFAWLIWRKKSKETNARQHSSDFLVDLPQDSRPTEHSIVYEKSHDSVNLSSISGRHYKQTLSPKQELPGAGWRTPAELAAERF